MSGIGFQFHNHDTKKNILSEKKIGGGGGVKNHVFNKKSRISGIFKKTDLDFKDTKYRL